MWTYKEITASILYLPCNSLDLSSLFCVVHCIILFSYSPPLKVHFQRYPHMWPRTIMREEDPLRKREVNNLGSSFQGVDPELNHRTVPVPQRDPLAKLDAQYQHCFRQMSAVFSPSSSFFFSIFF